MGSGTSFMSCMTPDPRTSKQRVVTAVNSGYDPRLQRWLDLLSKKRKIEVCPVQKNFMNACYKHDIVGWIGGREIGKTMAIVLLLAELEVSEPDATVRLITSSHKAAAYVEQRVRKIVGKARVNFTSHTWFGDVRRQYIAVSNYDWEKTFLLIDDIDNCTQTQDGVCVRPDEIVGCFSRVYFTCRHLQDKKLGISCDHKALCLISRICGPRITKVEELE